MDRETLGTLDTLQLDESAQRYTGCARCEAENLGSFFTIEGLERSPPPNDNRIGACVAIVLGSSAPFVHVDVRGSGDQKFELFLIELYRIMLAQ